MAVNRLNTSVSYVDDAMREALHGTPARLERALGKADFSGMAKQAYRLVQQVMVHIHDGAPAELHQALHAADYAALGNARTMLQMEVQKHRDGGLSHHPELWAGAAAASDVITREMTRRTSKVPAAH